MRFVFLIFTLTFFLVSVQVQSQQAGLYVSGKLLNSDQTPLNAIIKVTDIENNVFSNGTDSSGNYNLYLPEVGVYDIAFTFENLLNVEDYTIEFRDLDLTQREELRDLLIITPFNEQNKLKLSIDFVGLLDVKFPSAKPSKVLVGGIVLTQNICSDIATNNWCHENDNLRLKFMVEDKQPVTETEFTSIKSGFWSDASVWKTNKVPSTNDAVLISTGTEVEYDKFSDEEIENVTVMGKLKFSRAKDTQLDVGNIIVQHGGYLEAGIFSNPIPSSIRSSIRFVVSDENQFVGGPEFQATDIGLWTMHGGKTEIHGSPIKITWTKLVEDASAGSNKLIVNDTVDWKAGDKVIITSTTDDGSETEENTISSISGKTITLQTPLSYSHDGKNPAQAEVGLLSRNVLITSKYGEGRRAHTIYMHGSYGSISYAEFKSLGVFNKLGRYPIHFHMAEDTLVGTFVIGASIWNSGNRCITVHSTNGIAMENNVAYNSTGHCYFLETGSESGAFYRNNFVSYVKQGPILSSDCSSAAGFWMQSTNHTYVNNVASAAGVGFGLGPGKFNGPITFTSNEAHSNVIKQENYCNGTSRNTGIWIYKHSAGIGNKPSVGVVKDLKVWRNEIGWSQTGSAEIRDSLFFGNRNINIEFGEQKDSKIINSTILGKLPDDGSKDPKTKIGARIAMLPDYKSPHQFINTIFANHSTADVTIWEKQEAYGFATLKDSKVLSDKGIIFELEGKVNVSSWIRVENYDGKNKNILPKDFVLFKNNSNSSIVSQGCSECDFSKCIWNENFTALLCPLD